MKVPLTFSTEGVKPRDMVVEFDSAATVAQLESELRAVTRDRSTGTLWLGGRRLGQDDRLVDVGLVAGAHVGSAPAAGAEIADVVTPLELAVVGGLDAGRSYLLGPARRPSAARRDAILSYGTTWCPGCTPS